MIFSHKIFPCILSLIFITLLCLSCSNKTNNTQQGESVMSEKSIEFVLKEHTDKLMAIPGVVGTAQGLYKDKPCIKVYVTKKTEEIKRKIPKTIDGFYVDIEVTGEFRAL